MGKDLRQGGYPYEPVLLNPSLDRVGGSLTEHLAVGIDPFRDMQLRPIDELELLELLELLAFKPTQTGIGALVQCFVVYSIYPPSPYYCYCYLTLPCAAAIVLSCNHISVRGRGEAHQTRRGNWQMHGKTPW
jgi:hypothetical protein